MLVWYKLFMCTLDPDSYLNYLGLSETEELPPEQSEEPKMRWTLRNNWHQVLEIHLYLDLQRNIRGARAIAGVTSEPASFLPVVHPHKPGCQQKWKNGEQQGMEAEIHKHLCYVHMKKGKEQCEVAHNIAVL